MDIKRSFINYIQKSYEPKNPNVFNDFEESSYKEFCEELKKQKVRLSVNEKKELLTIYDESTTGIINLSRMIQDTQFEIDNCVFEIYGIDESVADRIRVDFRMNI